MIQTVYIKNFKAWRKESFSLNGTHVAFVGEHGSGKSSILQALDYFFNHDRIEAECVIDPTQDVEIGIRLKGTFLKKRFTGRTHRATIANPQADWSVVEGVHYLHLFAPEITPTIIVRELCRTRIETVIDPTIIRAIERASRDIFDDLLAGMDNKLPASSLKGITLTGKPRVSLAKALDYDIAFDDTPSTPSGKEDESSYASITKALLTGSTFDSVILGIDEMENFFGDDDFDGFIAELERSFAQLLFTTHSGKILESSDNIQTIPLGSNPRQNTARILSGLESRNRIFVLVEGKFDLPWYQRALDFIDPTETFIVLPGGGSNTTLLRRELKRIGIDCLLIMDGDMKDYADERHHIFTLERDCIELYTPDDVLLDLFGCIPSKRSKTRFFRDIHTAGVTMSDDGIKDAIAERIAVQLTRGNPFVRELEDILDRAVGRPSRHL